MTCLPRRTLQSSPQSGRPFDPVFLQALFSMRGLTPDAEVWELTLDELRIGMVLSKNVKLPGGLLLIARGYEVSARFLIRMKALNADAAGTNYQVLARRRCDA